APGVGERPSGGVAEPRGDGSAGSLAAGAGDLWRGRGHGTQSGTPTPTHRDDEPGAPAPTGPASGAEGHPHTAEGPAAPTGVGSDPRVPVASREPVNLTDGGTNPSTSGTPGTTGSTNPSERHAGIHEHGESPRTEPGDGVRTP